MKEKIRFEDEIIDYSNVINENPMLYSYKEEKKAQSIEEFRCRYKRKDMALGYIIRSEGISIDKKYKVLKKYFRNIKKEYKKEYKRIINELPVIDTNIDNKMKKRRLSIYIILLELISSLVVIFFGKKIEILSSFVNNIYFKILFIVFNILLFLSIILRLILSVDNREKRKKAMINEYEQKIKNHQKIVNKEYKKVRKYYLRNILKDKTFEPTGFYKSWELDNLETIVNNLESNSKEVIRNITKKRKKLTMISILTILVSLSLEILFIVLVIRSIIK